ncbi:MAG: DUF4139 domain-containing protein [Bacteroidia bacterium]
MKSLFVFTLLISGFLFAQEKTTQRISTDVNEAVVFRQRAMLSHKKVVTLRPGTQQLLFTGLSPSLIASSVQVKGEGPGTILAVTTRKSFLQNTPKTSRMIELEDSLQTIADTLAWWEDELAVLAEEEGMILKNGVIKGEETGLEPMKVDQLAEIYRRRLRGIRRARTGIRQKKRTVNRVQFRLAYEYENQKAERNKQTHEVVVNVKAEKTGSFEFEVKYLTANASWGPAYDMRVEGQDKPISGALIAVVTNNTGLDWNQTKLTLSTAANAGSNVVPELNPQYVRINPAVTYKRYKGSPSGDIIKSAPKPAPSMSNRRDVREKYDKDGRALQTPTVEVSENELAMEFAIELPYDIPADAEEHRVPVQQFELKASFHHMAVPKKDKDVFLVAMIQEDLLRGPANIYYQGSFVGTTYIDTDDPTDTMKLTLGRDPGIQVEREAVTKFTSRQSLGSQVKVSRGFELTIRNVRKTSATLRLLDQVPVSTDKAVEIKVTEISGANHNLQTGTLQWNITLAPGETKKLLIRYEAKFPKNRAVSGL